MTRATDYLILGVPVIDWGVLVLLGVLFSVGLLAAHRLATGWLENHAARTTNQVYHAVLEIIRATKGFFIAAVAILIALVFAGFPEASIDAAGKLFILVALVQVIFWGNGLITWWITGFRERNMETDASAVTTIKAIGFIGRLALFSVVLLLALDNMGFDVTTLIAGLGIVGIAIGLALQSVFGDLLASLSIVFDKPFIIGDFIVVGDIAGTVEDIGLETTRIRSLTGEQIVMSNSDLINSRLRNYKRMSERRVVFTLGVTYETPYEAVEAIPRILRDIVESQQQARLDRAHFASYGDFALIFEVVYYVLSPEYGIYMDIQQDINLAIHRKFEEEGIEFAYPTQTLFLDKSGLSAEKSSTGRSAEM